MDMLRQIQVLVNFHDMAWFLTILPVDYAQPRLAPAFSPGPATPCPPWLFPLPSPEMAPEKRFLPSPPYKHKPRPAP